MQFTEDRDENSMIGSRIGSYRLDEEIGRGGLGAVYRASRVDGEFSQKVAIKLIKRGMDTDMILRRFRRERQILATLDHPNIAYFLGGGSTEDGLPYFVMEYIDGLPLYKYCSRGNLPVRERLSIFRQVCWAVAVAHEKQIVHRDLKPSNILVSPDGKPKLLDFGIAKALDPDLFVTEGEPTATQFRAMTPEYASPEQVSGEPVGAASDIYSLGVILYELVTGHRPYRLIKRVPHEIERIIREELPTNPSGAITRESDLVPENGAEPTLERVFRSRSSTPDELKREISGDLERIIMKALRKRPDERYANATAFADDITSYLEGRPVSAEYFVTMRNLPAGTRNKLSIGILPFSYTGGDGSGEGFVGVGMADALVTRLSSVRRLVVRPTTSVLGLGGLPAGDAAKVLGVDYLLEGRVRAAGNRLRVTVQLYDAANGSSDWARSFDRDVGDVLEVEDSIAEEVVSALLPQLSSEEKRRLSKRGTDNPAAYEAYMRGRYFWSRFSDEGLLKAVAEFEKAIEIDPNYVLPYIGLADYYSWSAIFGEIPSHEGFPKAQQAARKALEIDEGLGEAYAALGFTVLLYDWNWDDAEYLLKRALELSPNYPAAHEFYSNWLVTQGRHEEGIAEIRRAEELDPVSPRAILMTAWTLYQCRRFEESVEKARKAHAMQPDLPQALLHLGNALIHTDDLEEATEILRKSSELWRFAGLPRYMLAYARAAQGDKDSVAKVVSKMEATEQGSYLKPYFLAMAYVAAGDNDKAVEWFERAADERNEWLVWFATEPKLDAIRSDPRYNTILERTRNPIASEEQKETTDPQKAEKREHSIAVLPFKMLSHGDSSSAEDDYLGIGIADAVTMRLSNIRRFIVRPTSSVIPFSTHSTDPFEAGRELKVEFVVDGLIRHMGDSVRVTAQLLDVEEGSTRWSASFLEPMKDLLEFEDTISEQVTRNLLPKLSTDEQQHVAKRGTNVARAHDEYLQGRYFWNLFTPDAFPRSIEHFRRAVELDPQYALAQVGIADYYTWATIYGMLTPRDSLEKVREHAYKALEIDPSLGEAHAAMGLYFSNRQEYEKAEESYHRAIELNPNYDLAHEWLSSVLVGTGRFEEGTKEMRQAESLNPLSLRPKVLAAWTFYQTRDHTAALAKSTELFELSPGFMQSSLQLANNFCETGDYEQAVEYSRKAMELEPASPLPLYVACFSMVRAGINDEAHELLNEWESVSREHYLPPYFLGMSHIALGNIDRAFELLFAAVEEKSPWALWIGTEPKLDPLRNDPRYRELLEKANNPILRSQFP